MPSLRFRERQISNLEGFDVVFLNAIGRDLRSDLENVPPYRFERGAKGDLTVSQWKDLRFKPTYAGYDCQVLDGNGRLVPGNTKLETVRESYFEE